MFNTKSQWQSVGSKKFEDEIDYIEQAKLRRKEEQAKQQKTLARLKATMVPKQTTEEEKQIVQQMLNNNYKNFFVVPTDDKLEMHRASYGNSQGKAKYTFGEYMQNFLTLNRDLRTDSNNVTSLLDNVPCVFYMPEGGAECYYSFTINSDLNEKGSILIHFEASKSVRVFVSDTKKPQPSNCQKEYPDPNKPAIQ